MDNFFKALKQAVGEDRLMENEPMSRHTTFRVGGPARYFLTPDSEEKLKDAVSLCREYKIPYYILGNGSNLLVSDKGYDGAMIHLGEAFSRIEKTGEDLLSAGAGALLSQAAREALKFSLTGFEFAAGIPGSLGGAVVMNAGAYGGEMKDVVESAWLMTKDGEITQVSAAFLELGYRKSSISKSESVLLTILLRLERGNAKSIGARMEELALKRREKQPLEYPSAGSTFKRPKGYYAGKLIEDAGLRGFQVGGAQISEKHCGFVINRDHATANDIYTLCREVQKRVEMHSGVRLETEVKMLGF